MGETDRERLLRDLLKAIIWYSNENHYESDVEKDMPDILLDRGHRAREVIRSMKEHDERDN